MTLSDKQAAFFQALVAFVATYDQMVFDGARFRFRLDYARRSREENERIGGHPNSNHLHRLAVDLILDWSDDGDRTWHLLEDGSHPVWRYLHGHWESRFGGAPMIPGDAGHFSFDHEGVR